MYLAPGEKIRFVEHLARLSETDFHQVIEHMRGIDVFNGFLFEETQIRLDSGVDRAAWLGRVQIDPGVALNRTLPSSSTVANSNNDLVEFPRKVPAVCPAILRCKSFQKFHDVFKTEARIATTCLPRWREFLRPSSKMFGSEKERCDEMFPFLRSWMADILGVAAWNGQSKTFASTNSKIDIVFFAPDLQNWPLVIIEYKNEARNNTNADPIAQATHYYLQQLQAAPLQGAFKVPALIL